MELTDELPTVESSTYDPFGRLSTVTSNDGSTEAKYRYNANNLRASKTVNGAKTDYVWNGQNLAAETKNGTTTVYSYDPTGVVMSKTGSDSAVRYIKDAHGNVVAAAQNGAVVNEYQYSAFGNQISNTEEISNPFRYCGEYYDEESGNIYLRNRYYQPETGRFITEDPAHDGQNWYVYAGKNPIMMIDPSGLGITCSTADSGEILKLLRELTDDEIDFFENVDKNGNGTGTGEIKIVKSHSTDNHVGQTLISSLINDDVDTNIEIGLDPNTQETNCINIINNTCNIYIDPNDIYGLGKPITVEMVAQGDFSPEEIPNDILLGHELIHAWRYTKNIYNYSQNEDFTTSYDAPSKFSREEELRTVGIDYYNKNLELVYHMSTYENTITENGLRIERELNKRVSYYDK